MARCCAARGIAGVAQARLTISIPPQDHRLNELRLTGGRVGDCTSGPQSVVIWQ